MAAVLACGADAVLSHGSAAELWELLPVGDGPVSVPAAALRKAIREAEFRGLDLADTPTDHTRSELERAFLRLCRRFGLPEPEVNVRIGGFRVDFLWREQRVAVETDGYRVHRGRQAFEDDRERELALGMLGIRLRRFTDRQVHMRSAQVAAAVGTALRDDRG
jgi:very-short-patch-repair endonuclease